MQANHRSLKEIWDGEDDPGYELAYALVQTNENLITEMGDVFAGRYLMVNGYHLVDLAEIPEETKSALYIVHETIKNHSVANAKSSIHGDGIFTRKTIDVRGPYQGPKYCERISVSYEKFYL